MTTPIVQLLGYRALVNTCAVVEVRRKCLGSIPLRRRGSQLIPEVNRLVTDLFGLGLRNAPHSLDAIDEYTTLTPGVCTG